MIRLKGSVPRSIGARSVHAAHACCDIAYSGKNNASCLEVNAGHRGGGAARWAQRTMHEFEQIGGRTIGVRLEYIDPFSSSLTCGRSVTPAVYDEQGHAGRIALQAPRVPTYFLARVRDANRTYVDLI